MASQLKKSSKPSLRFLELLLDGLRPGHEAPTHDPLTIAQLDRILRHLGRSPDWGGEHSTIGAHQSQRTGLIDER